MAAENGLRVIEVTPDIDVRTIVRDTLAAGLKSFVVAGGDGSIHYVVQALVGTEGELGVVPIGSVNHLARDLGIPLDWREAFEVALRGTVRQIDVGRANGLYFLNSVMLGLYPTLSVYRERFRSTHSKWSAYAKAIRLAIRQFPHVTLVLEMDGGVQTIRTQMFTVAVNSYDLTQTGLVAPKTTFNDGRLSIYSLSFMGRLQFIRAAAKFFRGRITDMPEFRGVRTPQIRIDSPRQHLRISLDGELVDMQPPLQIAAVPASLLVRAPAE